MKLRTIARLMLAFVSLVFLVPLNSLPASADTLPVAPGNPGVAPKVTSPDTDGDGLSDSVETNGYDADGDGRPEVDYKKMGANPYHKDVFVEMDYMPGELASEEELDRIVQSFADLNVTNPDGRAGVNLHLDAGSARSAKYNLGGGNEVPHQMLTNNMKSSGELANIRARNFDSARYNSGFDYMIWGDYYVDNKTGNRNSSGVGLLGSPGFMVTVGKTYWEGANSDIRVGTFIHELGHNLNLKHGGTDEFNGKPQYYSVMNYNYQLTGIPKADGTRYFGYLQQDMPTLNEWALNERDGLGPQASEYLYTYKDKNGKDVTQPANQPIDFNRNGVIDNSPVSVDLNGDGILNELTALSDLKKLNFDMTPTQAGAGGPVAQPEAEENPVTADDARNLGLIP